MTKKLVELEKSEDNSKNCGNPSIRLSRLVKAVVELKALALCPKSDSRMRDKLYRKINHLEYLLLELKDINVELKRDWWEE